MNLNSNTVNHFKITYLNVEYATLKEVNNSV